MNGVLKKRISCWKFSPLIFQDMAAQRCVNTQCNKYAKRESVYCGTDCIHQHAKDSLRVLNRYDAKRGKAVSTDRHSVYREIFTQFYFLSLLPSLSAGDFKSGESQSIKFLSLNTILFCQIQEGAKPFSSLEGRK